MKKFLNSPIGAGLLLLLACIAIYFNVVRPMMGGGSSATEAPAEEVVAEPAPAVEATAESTPLPDPALVETTDPATAAAMTSDGKLYTVVGTPGEAMGSVEALANVGYRRAATRDPFLLESRRGLIPRWLREPATLDAKGEAHAKAPRSNNRRSNNAERIRTPIFRAMFQGPAGATALVSGRMVKLGDSTAFGTVLSINAYELRLRKSSGDTVSIPFVQGGSR